MVRFLLSAIFAMLRIMKNKLKISRRGGKVRNVKCNIAAYQFVEDDTTFLYAPAFGLMTFGDTIHECHVNMSEQLQLFFEHLVENNNFNEALTELGWGMRVRSKPTPPTVSKLQEKDDLFNDILERDSYSKSNLEVAMPTPAA